MLINIKCIFVYLHTFCLIPFLFCRFRHSEKHYENVGYNYNHCNENYKTVEANYNYNNFKRYNCNHCKKSAIDRQFNVLLIQPVANVNEKMTAHYLVLLLNSI